MFAIHLKDIELVRAKNPAEAAIKALGKNRFFRIEHFSMEFRSGITFRHHLGPFAIERVFETEWHSFSQRQHDLSLLRSVNQSVNFNESKNAIRYLHFFKVLEWMVVLCQRVERRVDE